MFRTFGWDRRRAGLRGGGGWKRWRFGYYFVVISLWCAILGVLYAGSETNLFVVAPRDFRSSKQALQVIPLRAVDDKVLSAALFHETNLRRAEHGLPLLKHHPKLIEAAKIQTRILKERTDLSHENPDIPEHEDPAKRVKAVGLKPRFVAENLAKTGALRNSNNAELYKRTVRGSAPFYSLTPDGPALAPHTYASFAKTVVDQWMGSPGHRKNILHKKAKYLGCYGEAKLVSGELPYIVSTQVFFTPAGK